MKLTENLTTPAYETQWADGHYINTVHMDKDSDGTITLATQRKRGLRGMSYVVRLESTADARKMLTEMLETLDLMDAGKL